MLVFMNGTTHAAQTMKATVVVALLAVVVACGAPATVEGVFASDTFRLESERPLAKPTASGRDMVVVLSQVEAETLRTVTILIPHINDRALGEPQEVGSGELEDARVSLEAAVGDLVVETRADGAQIISSTNNTYAASIGGTFTVDARDADGTVAGSFSIDLDDGGFLEGSFVAARSN